MLAVQYAFHSAQMAPFQHQLVEQLGVVRAGSPTVAVYSTVTGGLAKDVRFDAAYFGRNVRDPVQFAGCINAMARGWLRRFHRDRAAAGAGQFDRRMSFYARACAGGFGIFASRPAGARNFVAVLCWRLCGRLRFGLGARPAERRAGCRTAGLSMAAKAPLDPSTPSAQRGSTAAGHPMLGHRIPVAGIEAEIFEASSDRAQAWLIDHRIFGRLLVPAAAVLETLTAAAETVLGLPQRQLTGFVMHRPLILSEQGEGQTRWQVVVKSFEDGRAELEWHEAICEANGDVSAWHRIAFAVAEPAAESILAKEPGHIKLHYHETYHRRCNLRRVQRSGCGVRSGFPLPS